MSAHDQFVMQMGGGLRWLAKRHGLKIREVTVLSTLILFDEPGGCRPSQDAIAEVSGTTRGVVQPALGNLEAAGLIKKEALRYWDSRGRERHSKSHLYILSQEVGEALEFAAETLELKRRATQPSLFADDPMRGTANQIGTPDVIGCQSDRDQASLLSQQQEQPPEFPMRLAANPIGIPDVIGCQSDRDQASPISGQEEQPPEFPMRLAANPVGIPDAIGSQSDRDPIGLVANPYIGGGGKKDKYMTMIRSLTPTTPPNPEERELSLQMMMHPAIAMPRDFAQAVAARWSPREILGRCRAYSADYNTEGGANGVGALIYRFAHFDSIPNRETRREDSYDYEWYSEFEYLVGLQEGLYVPETEEEEPESVLEPAYASKTTGPRPALVLADTLTDPKTAEAVFNTMELPAQRLDEDQQAWEAVVAEMAMVLPAATYHTWLHGQTEFAGSTEGKFTIRTTNAFVRDWLHSRARKKMEAALQAKTGKAVEIDFLTNSQIVEETRSNDSPDRPETLYEVQAVQASRPAFQPSGRN